MANQLINLFGAIALDSTVAGVSAKLPASLGKKTAANSLSVTFSSDESALPVSGTVALDSATLTALENTTVTANAGTNLNTSALALESGGNLAAILAKLNSSVAVTGTFWQATQPVSGPATDAQLRATPLPVSGTVTANTGLTQPLTDAQLRAAAVPISDGGGSITIDATSQLPVTASNVPITFRDSFDNPSSGYWTDSIGAGDIVRYDGNAAGSSYKVISKDPLTANSVTTMTTVANFAMPLELAIGAHMSQRTLGQELSVEVVSTDTPLAAYTDRTITAIQQATTTLTVTTSTAHGLVVGGAISIYGCTDSRMNYTALVVATTPSPTQFTCTAGPGGALPSVTAGPFASGFVTMRQRLGLAQSGISQIFENTTATNASLYVRSNAGDALPSGTIAGAHVVTTASTASVQAVNAAYNYAFQPTSEFRFAMMADRTQWSDSALDTVAQSTSRLARSQVIPDNTKQYKLRFRFTNNRGLSMPVAKIISMQKTGTTTATVTTDVAHGLTTADFINIYGSSDQTAYANLTAATAVASIISTTQFTVVIGTAVTSTVYGGYVARVNGGQVMQGAITQVAVSATLATAADGTQALTLTGNAAWSGLLIGDYVNVHGLRSVPATGADLGCDGAWLVRNVSGTALELGAIGTTTPPSNFGATVCGGGVIKRTDMRVSYVRTFDFERLRVEMLPRPANDMAAAAPTVIQNTPAVTISSGTVTTVTGVTTVAAVTSANLGIPTLVADVASAAITTTATTAAFTPTFGTTYTVNIPVTAVTGTNPTLDVGIEESDDTATNWFRVYDFERITAVGMYRSEPLTLRGNRIRYVQTVTGTTPSFTRAINRLQRNDDAPLRVMFVDRTIVPNTLNSVTPTYYVGGCVDYNFVVRCTAQTTPATLTVQFSSDGVATNWHTTTNTLATINGIVHMKVQNEQWKFARLIVTAAGTGITLGEVTLRGVGA